MTVLLLGPSEDRELCAVESRLDRRGVTTEILDTGNLLESGQIAYRQNDQTNHIQWDDMSIADASTVRSVYVRRLGLDPRIDGGDEALERRPVSYLNQLREYRALVMSILNELRVAGVPMVNEPQPSISEVAKPYQHASFTASGVPVPESLTTNDPAEVKSFVTEVDTVIYKPVAGGGQAAELTASDLSPNRLEKLSNSPVLFQEQVTGENLRLYVLDGEVIASVRIESEALDYRSSEHTVTQRDVSAEMEDAAVTAAKAVDLRFAGIDIIADGDRFVVLEANSSPMFATVDEHAGTDIADSLAETLSETTDS